MTATHRLPAEERRRAIVAAVKKVFAVKGFDGATTRELAEAAGVSEALLYKHFPSKESLFEAMRDDCTRDPSLNRFWRVMELDASTSTLVLLVHALAHKLIVELPRRKDEDLVLQMALRSLLEDGVFARMMSAHFAESWLPKFSASVAAAKKSGDLVPGGVRPDLAAWFLHNLAVMIALQNLPRRAAIDYAAEPNELVAQAVRFSLRGLGLKESAITRHYNPKALAMLADG